MKNYEFKNSLSALFLIGICLVFASTANGQDWARKMFKEFSHDFGDVQKGEVPECRFQIENVFEEDIHIAQVSSSCGCTSVSLSKNVLKTWEKGEVVCRFNSPAFDGFKQATVTVRFSRPYVGEVQLNVRGNIVRGTNFSPNSINFGQVTEDSLPTKTIKLTHSGSPDFRIIDIKSTFSHIGVSLKETSRNGPLVTYEMTAKLKDTVPQGFSQGELYVVVEANRQRQELPIKFSAKVVSSSLQIPETVSMGTIQPGEQVTRRVILKADQPFKITDVTSLNNAFKVKANQESKKVHFVEVIYVASDEPGHHECELSFYTDLARTPSGKTNAVVDVVAAGDTPDLSATNN